MARSPETLPDQITYAGANPYRQQFLQYIVGGEIPVFALGGGIEPHTLNPLYVARQKVVYVQERESPRETGSNCYVAFDTLTSVPIFSPEGFIQYETYGKPSDPGQIQHVFWEMDAVAQSFGESMPYRITSASVLQCHGLETQATHASEITLSQRKLHWLATDRGVNVYTTHMESFGYSFNRPTNPMGVAGGLHIESLLALGCVEAIDGIPTEDSGFSNVAERAIFLATIGASHRVLGPLTHDPLGHIVKFPHHQDTLTLVKKHMGHL